MRVLALDIATNSGWAADRPDGGDAPISGEFRVPTDGEDLGLAFVVFERQLLDLMAVHQPDVLCFEAPLPVLNRNHRTAPTSEHTVRLLFGLASVAELVGRRADLEVYEAKVQTVRKHFVGNGYAGKPEVAARCRLLGWKVVGHDAADACAAWDFARHTLRRPTANAGPLLDRAHA